MPDMLIAKSSAVVDLEGIEYTVVEGKTRVRASDKLARRNPELFEPLEVSPDIETATKAPGEKRGKK